MKTSIGPILCGILLLSTSFFYSCKKEKVEKNSSDVQLAIIGARINDDANFKTVDLEGAFISDAEFNVSSFGAILFDNLDQVEDGDTIGTVTETRTKAGNFSIHFTVQSGVNRYIKIFAKTGTGILYSGNTSKIDELIKLPSILKLTSGTKTFHPGEVIDLTSTPFLPLIITNLTGQPMEISSIEANISSDFSIENVTATPPATVAASGGTFAFNLSRLKQNPGTLVISTTTHGVFIFQLGYIAPLPDFQLKYAGGPYIPASNSATVDPNTLNLQLEVYNAGTTDFTINANNGNTIFTSSLIQGSTVAAGTATPFTITYTGNKLSEICPYDILSGGATYPYTFIYNSGLTVQDSVSNNFDNDNTIYANADQQLRIFLTNNSGQTVSFSAGDISCSPFILANFPTTIPNGGTGTIVVNVTSGFGSISIPWLGGKFYTFYLSTTPP